MYGDSPAIVVSDFNFVGYASTLLKKGANESFTVTNYFRDILIEPIDTIKEEDQVDIDLERAVNVCILTLWPHLTFVFVQDNLDSSCRDSTISVSEAVIGAIAVKEAPVEVLEEDVDGLLPPQVHSVAKPGEDGRKDALVGGEVEREAPATGGIVTIVIYH